MNLFQKICNERGATERDGQLCLKPDQVLIHDATGVTVFLQLEAMGVTRMTPFTVAYADHNTLQLGPLNSDDHIFMQGMSAKLGAVFCKPGYGICHQVHLENFSMPGQILLGADSHTPTCAGTGMLAIGSGGLDTALALAGESYTVAMPKVLGVRLTGTPHPLVGGKDVILELLRRITVRGGIGKVLEFFGPGVASLSVFDRATIGNMGAETGATSTLFPSDERTREYLASFGREKDFRPLSGDPDAAYDELVEIDLSALDPMAAAPHSPDNAAPVGQFAGTRVTQVMLGSCTNSSFQDLAVAAAILRGRQVHPEVEMVLAPGSRRTLSCIAGNGILKDLVDAGVRVLENTCGPCNGVGHSPRSGGVSLRTSNRNFKGRCGTPDAEVYLCGPAVAAASAVTGAITDPRELETGRITPVPASIPDPAASMVIQPPDDPATVTVIRSESIKPVPLGTPVPDTMTCVVGIRTGDNITTDDFLPGGQRMLSLRSNIPATVEYIFQRVDPAFAARAREIKGPWAVVGGVNLGQGSSREHAVMAPMAAGMKVALGKSLARIFCKNAVNNGVIPLVFDDPADYDTLADGDVLVFSDLRNAILAGCVSIENKTGGRTFSATCPISVEERELLLAGGVLNGVRTKTWPRQ